MRRLLAACLALSCAAGTAGAETGARIEGVGPYHFGMTVEEARATAPRSDFAERFAGAGAPFYGSGALTGGPPQYLLWRNFAVVLKFSSERRLYGVQLLHFDWVRDRAECAAWHREFVTHFAHRYGPLDGAAPAFAMQRVTNGEVTGLYIGLDVEDPRRDALIAPQLTLMHDGSRIQEYRATLAAPDLRRVNSEWSADEAFSSRIGQDEDGALARELSVSTTVRPLSARDRPREGFRYDCAIRVDLRDLTVESRVR